MRPLRYFNEPAPEPSTEQRIHTLKKQVTLLTVNEDGIAIPMQIGNGFGGTKITDLLDLKHPPIIPNDRFWLHVARCVKI